MLKPFPPGHWLVDTTVDKTELWPKTVTRPHPVEGILTTLQGVISELGWDVIDTSLCCLGKAN